MLVTRVCFALSPPLGDASFPLELVGMRFVLAFLIMVGPCSFGTLLDVTAGAGHFNDDVACRRLPTTHVALY